jgi:hypothetical protein
MDMKIMQDAVKDRMLIYIEPVHLFERKFSQKNENGGEK